MPTELKAALDVPRKDGFECIIDREVKRSTIIKLIHEKCRILKDNDIFLFYFSGHGDEENGKFVIYLSDAKEENIDKMKPNQGLTLNPLLRAFAVGTGIKIIILDCCDGYLAHQECINFFQREQHSGTICLISDKKWHMTLFPHKNLQKLSSELSEAILEALNNQPLSGEFLSWEEIYHNICAYFAESDRVEKIIVPLGKDLRISEFIRPPNLDLKIFRALHFHSVETPNPTTEDFDKLWDYPQKQLTSQSPEIPIYPNLLFIDENLIKYYQLMIETAWLSQSIPLFYASAAAGKTLLSILIAFFFKTQHNYDAYYLDVLAIDQEPYQLIDIEKEILRVSNTSKRFLFILDNVHINIKKSFEILELFIKKNTINDQSPEQLRVLCLSRHSQDGLIRQNSGYKSPLIEDFIKKNVVDWNVRTYTENTIIQFSRRFVEEHTNLDQSAKKSIFQFIESNCKDFILTLAILGSLNDKGEFPLQCARSLVSRFEMELRLNNFTLEPGSSLKIVNILVCLLIFAAYEEMIENDSSLLNSLPENIKPMLRIEGNTCVLSWHPQRAMYTIYALQRGIPLFGKKINFQEVDQLILNCLPIQQISKLIFERQFLAFLSQQVDYLTISLKAADLEDVNQFLEPIFFLIDEITMDPDEVKSYFSDVSLDLIQLPPTESTFNPSNTDAISEIGSSLMNIWLNICPAISTPHFYQKVIHSSSLVEIAKFFYFLNRCPTNDGVKIFVPFIGWLKSNEFSSLCEHASDDEIRIYTSLLRGFSLYRQIVEGGKNSTPA